MVWVARRVVDRRVGSVGGGSASLKRLDGVVGIKARHGGVVGPGSGGEAGEPGEGGDPLRARSGVPLRDESPGLLRIAPGLPRRRGGGTARRQGAGAGAVFFKAEGGIRDSSGTGFQTCPLPICCGCELDLERGTLSRRQ